MGETINITNMADLLSSELFNVFRWRQVGPKNINWPCTQPTKHNGVKTHPTDVVWFYDEPYENTRTYIQSDLKSYSKSTINEESIATALKNLANAVDCAEKSEEWKRHFLRSEDIPFKIQGMLFIYNHDGKYDSEFESFLSKLLHSSLRIPCNRSIAVFGPKDICELATIAGNIRQLGFNKEGDPQNIEYSSFYPEIKRKRYRSGSSIWKNALTINALCSNLITIKTRPVDSASDYTELHVYYRNSGQTRDEFLHLIDYLFCYQQLRAAQKIIIHFVSLARCEESTSHFHRAKDEYIDLHMPDRGLFEKLTFETVTNIVPAFNQYEIGMRGVN